MIFNSVVDSTRTPVEVRQDHQLEDIRAFIEKILGELQGLSIKELRKRNLAHIRGSLADQLEAWFSALGYELESCNEIKGGLQEWIIQVPGLHDYERILVHLTERRGESCDMNRLKESVQHQRVDEGWLVVYRWLSQGAREKVVRKLLYCYTFDELLDKRANFERYFNHLVEQVGAKGIDKHYIPLGFTKDEFDPVTREKTGISCYNRHNGWMETYIDQWLGDPCKEHISILGEFGTGKTWFALHYAYVQMQKYREAKQKGLERPRIPLVIPLRDFPTAFSVESLFSEFFFLKYPGCLPNFKAFSLLIWMGKLLLIFDGFDEMADRIDRQQMIDNFWELASLVVPGAKTILTCRSEHLLEAEAGRGECNLGLKSYTTNIIGQPPRFEVLNLLRFDEDQIDEALSLRTTPATLELILGQPQLQDVISRPVMLDFILEAVPEIEAGKPVDLARIYLYAVTRTMDQNITEGCMFNSPADKLFFLCELCWEMLTTDRMILDYRMIPARLKNQFGEVVIEEQNLDRWRHDMLSDTILIRNEDGDYTPAHRSLVEFLAAVRVLAKLGLLPPDFMELARRRHPADLYESLPPQIYTWSDYFYRIRDRNDQITRIAPLESFDAEDQESTFTSLPRLGQVTWWFIHEITDAEGIRIRFHELLETTLNEFKDGLRNPVEQQDLLRFILDYRMLCFRWASAEGKHAVIEILRAQHQQEWECAAGAEETVTEVVPVTQKDNITLPLVRIPAGRFLMGGVLDFDEMPIHAIDITQPFLLGTTTVTNQQYLAFVRATGQHNPVGMNARDRSQINEEKGVYWFRSIDLALCYQTHPIVGISWYDAVAFLNWLSEQAGLRPCYTIDETRVSWDRKADGYRLPTEAEWEYACRSGTTTPFACGYEDRLNEMAWYEEGDQDRRIHATGTKEPNAWGLYDMHGNVSEWVWDWFADYPDHAPADYVGFRRSEHRVYRGGWFGNIAQDCRSAYRYNGEPSFRIIIIGFRLARSLL